MRAHASGAWIELRKWVGRNRVLVAGALSVVAALAAGFATSALLYVREAHTAEQSRLLADLYLFQKLGEQVDELWPATPGRVAELERWLAQADELATRRAGYERRRAQLDDAEPSGAQLDDARQAQRAHLEQVCADAARFFDSGRGLVDGASREHGPGVRRRLAEQRRLADRSLSDESAAASWRAALASIADRAQCPAYAGLQIAPQFGLLPIGLDRESGLWEFAHLASGAVARADGARGGARLDEDSGLVLVLLPGGEFWMGAQSVDPRGRNYDPRVDARATVERAVVEPFFLSKFEMTQGQWLRCTQVNDAAIRAGADFRGARITALHPIENVSGPECDEVLRRLALTLPTPAQWEYAAREGRTSCWDDSGALAANVADASYSRQPLVGFPESLASVDDGYAVHAPVGSFGPNAFGLFDVLGNVYEFVAGEVAGAARDDPRAGFRQYRGGCFINLPGATTAASGGSQPPAGRTYLVGLRPARAIER